VLRDLVGRVRDETLRDSQGSRHEIYTHDDLGRLTVITSSHPARNRNFKYDILGNLTRHSILGDVKYGDPMHVHAMTDTQSGEHYNYDPAGQLLSSNQLEIDWSDDGRPARITNRATGEVSRYAYNVWGRRLRVDVGGSVTLYPHRLVQVEPGGAIMRWVWAEGRPLAYIDGAGVRFVHADVLGSVRLVTDGNSKVDIEYDYGAWGEATRATAKGGSAYRYAQSRRDDPTALAYMNARYYDSASTRFISADPIVLDVYAPQTLNRYAYALNDPVSLTDPSGLCVTYYEPGVTGVVDCRGPEERFREEGRAAVREEVRQARESGPSRPRQAREAQSDVRESGPPGLQARERQHDVKPLNFEFFFWLSREAKVEAAHHLPKTTIKVEAAAELIFIRGWNRTGPFKASVFATGGALSVERGHKEAYVALLGGMESVTQGTYGSDVTNTENEPIILLEGAPPGPALSGAYQTGPSGEHTGAFAGLRFGPWAIGAGADLDLLSLLLGPLGPAQTDNPWFQGPQGP
jgi:RHS repeat-associated protein